MPKELANQASYEGWRRSVGGVDCSLVEFHDWSNAGHPFDPVKEDFMTFIFQRKSRDQNNLPLYSYKKTTPRAKAHHWQHIEEANKHLSRSKKTAGQIIQGSTAYTIASSDSELEQFSRIAGTCAYTGREGIEFYPQEIMLFNYVEPGPASKKGTVWVKNIQVSKSKYKIPQQKILLETKYLFPLVKGPYIEAYNYDDPGILVAFPYDAANPHAPIPKGRLAKESGLLLAYYNKWKSVLEQQTHYSDSIRGEGEFYGVARTGPYSFRSCYVAFRDNTKWCASVLTQKKMPWGEEKRFVFQNHAVSICEGSNGAQINETEAYFIAGIFNAPIVGQFIQSSSDNRSFKIRPPVHVPLYDPKNQRHKEIARLSKLAAQKPKDRDSHIAALQAEYLAMCASRQL